MTWWLKTRATAGIAAAVLLTIVLGILADDAELPIPVLTGQSGSFLVGHLITVAPAAMLLYGISGSDHRIESIAVRPTHNWNAVLGLAAAALAWLAAALLYAVTGNDIAVVLGRNTAGYIGVAMAVAAFTGPRLAGAATALVPLLCAATGWAQGGQPEPWAWVLHPAQSSIAIAAAAVMLILGTVLTLTRSTTTRLATGY
ncbi:hypothetical protein ACFO9E_27555 [Streptomyces maoxianensis]|uniref:ABC transporter n=1 Tax=Streptomyces maoxianensis TaxID=1459942 RepID=A0ABV9GBN0_9ACTN